jgi:hypothetical protein
MLPIKIHPINYWAYWNEILSFLFVSMYLSPFKVKFIVYPCVAHSTFISLYIKIYGFFIVALLLWTMKLLNIFLFFCIFHFFFNVIYKQWDYKPFHLAIGLLGIWDSSCIKYFFIKTKQDKFMRLKKQKQPIFFLMLNKRRSIFKSNKNNPLNNKEF